MTSGGLRARAWWLGALWSVGVLAAAPASAQAPADFYKDRNLTIVSGHDIGGGFDAYVRLMGRHIGKYVPGKPNVIVSSMPGAGSMIAANHMFNVAPKDGSHIAQVGVNAVLQPILGGKNAQYRSDEFGWLGSMTQDMAFCAVFDRPGVPTSWEEFRKQEVLLGANSANSFNFVHASIIKEAFNLPLKIVSGYRGTKELGLAIERGEIAGQCGLFTSTINVQYANELASGKLKILVQMGPKKSTIWPSVPSVFDHVKDEETRQMLSVHFHSLALARPFLAPPKVPADRLVALRQAFREALADADLLAEAKKLRADIDYLPPDDLLKLVQQFYAYPKPVLARAAKFIE